MTNKKVQKQAIGDKAKLVQESADKLLSHMGVKAKASVSEDKETETIIVDIDPGNEAGLLIGRHGETLNSIQSILAIVLRQKIDEWIHIVVNAGDWRQRQEERLVALAKQAVERAKETGQPQHLYNLSSSERRVIHLSISKEKGIETESVGEGEERYLIVKPKE